MRHSVLWYKECVFLLMGLFSTCSCVAIVAAGLVVSAFSILLVLSFIILLTEKTNPMDLLKTKTGKYYTVWTFLGILSSIFGTLFFMGDDDWVSAALSYIPKILLYFFFLVLLLRTVRGWAFTESLLKGLIIGVVVNAGWATADAIIYYASGHSITNEIFRSYIIATNTRYDMLSLVIGGVIRSAGLNGDPANIGLFAPILASYSLYTKKIWLYVLSVVSIFASVSIVALAATLIITFFYMTSHKKAIGIGIIAILLLSSVIGYLSVQQDGVSAQMIVAVTERLEEKSESDVNDRDNARAVYWLKFLPAVATTPTALIIGTGYGTASYAYINGSFIDRNSPYDPEQTYFSTFFDVGLFGFIAFLALYINILRFANRRKDEPSFVKLFAGIEGTVIAFMGYHYTIYSVAMLFLIAGTVMCSLKSNHKFR